MTLVQTFFSSDLVIQVSDRRLTRADGSPFDDDYTKLICWNYAFTAGFTGLARIDRRQQKSTAEWIAEVLSDCPVFGYGVNVLRTETEAAVRKLPNNWDKRLAIVVAGFEGANGPLCAEISNFDTRTGRTTDHNTFSLTGFTMRAGRDVGSHTAGAPLDESQTSVLRRYVPRIICQQDGVNRALRVLVANQRRVAKTHNTVGHDAQFVYLPRNRQMHNSLMSNLGGTDIAAANGSYGFFDKDGFNYKQIGPLMAHGGFVLDQCEGTADPLHPGNQIVGFRFVKVPPSWAQSENETG